MPNSIFSQTKPEVEMDKFVLMGFGIILGAWIISYGITDDKHKRSSIFVKALAVMWAGALILLFTFGMPP